MAIQKINESPKTESDYEEMNFTKEDATHNKELKIFKPCPPNRQDHGQPKCSITLETKHHWSVAIPVENQKSYDLWPSCDPSKKLCDGGGDKERLRGNKHLWSSTLDQFRKSLKWRWKISFDE